MSIPSKLPPFNKPWLSIADQLRLLESRGLIIPDRNQAEGFLRHVNYYRFSGYCLAFEDSRHSFHAGTTFTEIQAAYAFDVTLRDLLTEALEVIEVDTRAAVAFIFGQKYGPFGHAHAANFQKSFRLQEWTDKLHEESERSSELFVEHFKANYDGFPRLPCWMVTEIMSFGMLSRMYGGLLDQCQSPIASRYNMQKGDLESTLHHLSYVRNICAHHCRLWDRVWAIAPRLPHGKNWQPPLVPDKKRLYVTLLLIHRILKRCSSCESFSKEWRRRVNSLIQRPPSALNAMSAMGLPAKWYNHPYWV